MLRIKSQMSQPKVSLLLTEKLKTKNSKTVINRMNYLIGHLRANLKMIEEGRYCFDIIRQNQAVMAALKKVNKLILENHLNTCVTTAIRGKSEKERKRVLKELVEIFKEEEK